MPSRIDAINRIYDTYAVTSKSRYVYVYDVSYDYARWSRNTLEYFDVEGEYVEHFRSAVEKLVLPEDLKAFQAFFADALRGKTEDLPFECRLRNKEGEYVVCSHKVVVIKDYSGNAAFLACAITNHGIVDNTDPITELPSQYELLSAMQELRIQKKRYALLAMNFVDFGEINRRYGYDFGNSLLKDFALGLRKLAGRYGRLFRGEGTTFILLSTNLTGDEVARVYEKLQDYSEKELMVRGQHLQMHLCGGLVMAGDQQVDEHVVYTSVLVALDSSRNKAQGKLIRYHGNQRDYDKNSLRIMDAVRNSVLHDFEGFYLEYQPIVDAETEKIRAMEVLLRWHKDSYGDVSTGEFIKWLERDPVFPKLGTWILEKSLTDTQTIRKAHPEITMNVNLAYMQLGAADFRSVVVKILRETGTAPGGLCLELSDDIAQWDPRHLKNQIAMLKSWSVLIALDVHSFAALDLVVKEKLPIDILKLGPEFAVGYSTSVTKRAVLESILHFAGMVSMKVCVTGVETEEIAEDMRKYGANSLQGYYYSRPVSLTEAEKLSFYEERDEKDSKEPKKTIGLKRL